jgi:hypothetical protein
LVSPLLMLASASHHRSAMFRMSCANRTRGIAHQGSLCQECSHSKINKLPIVDKHVPIGENA